MEGAILTAGFVAFIGLTLLSSSVSDVASALRGLGSLNDARCTIRIQYGYLRLTVDPVDCKLSDSADWDTASAFGIMDSVAPRSLDGDGGKE